MPIIEFNSPEKFTISLEDINEANSSYSSRSIFILFLKLKIFNFGAYNRLKHYMHNYNEHFIEYKGKIYKRKYIVKYLEKVSQGETREICDVIADLFPEDFRTVYCKDEKGEILELKLMGRAYQGYYIERDIEHVPTSNRGTTIKKKVLKDYFHSSKEELLNSIK